jgi:hypothetical protein
MLQLAQVEPAQFLEFRQRNLVASLGLRQHLRPRLFWPDAIPGGNPAQTEARLHQQRVAAAHPTAMLAEELQSAQQQLLVQALQTLRAAEVEVVESLLLHRLLMAETEQ